MNNYIKRPFLKKEWWKKESEVSLEVQEKSGKWMSGEAYKKLYGGSARVNISESTD